MKQFKLFSFKWEASVKQFAIKQQRNGSYFIVHGK
jgi:hypothetical protein